MGLVYLIRHAEPELTGVLLGRSDVSLRPAAIPPCMLDLKTLFSSPLRRARETAALLFPDRPVIVLEELAERSYGEWERVAWDEVKARWPEIAAGAERDWLGTTPPKGESWPELLARARRVWREIRGASSPVAVVAHGGLNSALAHVIDGRDPTKIQQSYLEVLTLEFESADSTSRQS
jgi:alpha-ribazole phosphatase